MYKYGQIQAINLAFLNTCLRAEVLFHSMTDEHCFFWKPNSPASKVFEHICFAWTKGFL